MLISYKWLSSYIVNPEKMPTPEKVADIFTMRAFEIESIEKKGDDTVYDIKILPDRSPYAYGIRYVALELSILVPELVFNPVYSRYIKTLIDVSDISNNPSYSIVQSLVEENAQKLCPLYTLTRIDNIHNNPSSKDIVEKLSVLGQQSRGTVVDLTNFVMNDTGQPLHAFDADMIDGDIRVSILDDDTEVTILGGKKINLKKNTLVIKDDKDILAIAGVKGCIKAEVTDKTKNIYLESASFDRVSVRKTSRSLDLINDSSKRFEQGVTIERVIVALQTYIELIKKSIPTCVVHSTSFSKDVKDVFLSENLSKIDVDIQRCVRLIDNTDNTLIQKFVDFIEQILPKTGAGVEKTSEYIYVVTSPIYRADLKIEADVVDEFIRYVGYDVVAYKATETVYGITQEKIYQVIQSIRKFLREKSYTEVLLHTLVDSKKNPDAIVLENSLTSERDSLRSDLSSELLVAIVKNYPYLDLVEKKSVELFEIGTVFCIEENTEKSVEISSIFQRTHLALGMGMPKWSKKTDDSLSCMSIMIELCKHLGVDEKILENANITVSKDKNVFIIEIDIEDIINLAVMGVEPTASQNISDKTYLSPNARIKTLSYKKASIYPSMSRDIAFFVEGEESKDFVGGFMRDIIKTYPLIETLTLFDVFTKEGKTSYGYRFVFQSYEKTLTEEEVSSVMLSLAEVIQSKGWIVR